MRKSMTIRMGKCVGMAKEQLVKCKTILNGTEHSDLF